MTRHANAMYEVPLCRLKELSENAASRNRLLALVKLIAETPESRDTIQVWAWQAYKRENDGHS